MSDERNIVIVGASTAGLSAAHYTLKHILPVVKAKQDAKYHVYLIAPSARWYYRVASPRVAASTRRMAAEKVIFDLHKSFAKYSKEDFTFVEASATGLDTTSRTIAYRSNNKDPEEKELAYHALIVATGTKTYHPAFSASSDIQDTLNAIKETNEKIAASKKIVIAGGGPTGIEFAGEVAEHLNGKPGLFSKLQRNATITLITTDPHLLPTLRPAISKSAAAKLKGMGVDILYNTRVLDTATSCNIDSCDLSKVVNLSDGSTLEADYYVPAYGVIPNSTWLPDVLLDEKRYLKNNAHTLRVDAAGPRVYAFGDIGSHSNNTAWQISQSLPVLVVNLTRDLLAFDAANPEARPKGKDRRFVPDAREMGIVPIGSVGGVGAVMGWKVPSWFVWLIKGRDYMVGLSAEATASGGSVGKRVKLEKEEEVI
ncbi:hypothetical protein IAQ61_007081 [Plenodomus lingam]|uniref:uncharacterized protein n=1 Tax=Leptosphaeria maculans TaxID=5022 RepID=UPI003322B993|nr:hypothetical protein IAQ61_007081 [Plenodomus lingam]